MSPRMAAEMIFHWFNVSRCWRSKASNISHLPFGSGSRQMISLPVLFFGPGGMSMHQPECVNLTQTNADSSALAIARQVPDAIIHGDEKSAMPVETCARLGRSRFSTMEFRNGQTHRRRRPAVDRGDYLS